MKKTDNQSALNDDVYVNEVWHLGMRSHLATKTKRIEFIDTLVNNNNSINPKTYINELAYLMHTYFYSMDDYEKDKYVEAFLIKEYNSSFVLGEVIELLGIIFKGSPKTTRTKIITYIKKNAEICIDDASAIISLCNCIRCLYDEICVSEQNEMLLLLINIKDNNKFGFVNESIELTITAMKEVTQ